MKKTDIVKLALSGKSIDEIRNLIELEDLIDEVEKKPEAQEAPEAPEVPETPEAPEEAEDSAKIEALNNQIDELNNTIEKLQKEFKNRDISSDEDDIYMSAQTALDNLVKSYM